MSQTIQWLGHATWKMVTPQGTRILIDPWIEGNPACPVTLDDINDIDLVCVTHAHSDHLGNAIEICNKTHAVLVTLPEIGLYCARYGVPYDENNSAVGIGGSVRQKDVRIRGVYAMHSSDVWGYANQKDPYALETGSGACGFVIEPDGGKSVYFAGDTGLFGDMAIISKMYHPYVSVLPIGDKFIMGIREAAVACGLLNSAYVIPGHYNTFDNNQADTERWKELVAQEAPATKPVVLKPGETFLVP